MVRSSSHIGNVVTLMFFLAGSTVRLVEEDDGSGWVKVADSRGGKGLVPITYLQIGQSGRDASPVPAVNQGSGKFGMSSRLTSGGWTEH